ncbi:MAG: hypothetical protein Q7K43_01420, partial [Candidatus Woesearchaeota archaeon]|nr:hypothetical protein [Candidatus Woesearchaeota archaeon]
VPPRSPPVPASVAPVPSLGASADEKAKFSSLLEDLIGTRGAYLLDNKLQVLGKIPLTELVSTLATLRNVVYAVVFDGIADQPIVTSSEQAGVKHVIAMDAKATSVRLKIVTAAEL